MHPIFKISTLSALLLAGFARADDIATQAVPTINVKSDRTDSTRRVNIKQLDETTATELKEVLSSEPSVSFGGGNGTSQWISIRGMGQEQIDVKVDNTYSDSQLFHHNSRFLLDPSLIKVIGVQKGTGSASAGIGATSGAIVARTIDAKDLLRDGKNAGFKLNGGWSSNKGYHRGATVFGSYQGFDALVSGNWIHEDNYKDGHGNKVNHSGLGQRGLLAKFSYDFNAGNRLTLSHRQEKTYGERALREEFDFSQEGDAARNDPRYRVLTQDTTNLEYENKNLGALGGLKANVYHKKDERTENSKMSVKTNGANIGFDTPVLDRHLIKYGINWRGQKSYPSSLAAGGSREQKTDVGGYVEGIWNFTPVTLTTGLRYDYFNVTFSGGTKISDSNVSPSVGLIYDVLPNLSLSANYNLATRSPRLTEALLASGNGRNGTVTLRTADADLKAERSRNAEIGFKYNLGNTWNVEGNYFRQTIKNVQAVSRNRYHNGGTLKNNGFEFSNVYRRNGLTARAGVAYNKPKTSGAAIDSFVIAVPIGRTWTAGLAYQFDNPNIEIGWKGRFVQSSNQIVTSTRGATTTTTPTKRSGYGVNDIYVNWKPTGKDDLNINFAVNNIGDKYYKPHSQRESGSGSSLPEVGRDFRLGMNYTF